jgi:mannose-6-phosphate isomerase-like protein (cupin superfamily)
MEHPTRIDITETLAGLEFLSDRTPTTTDPGIDWSARVSEYRDGAVFLVHFAGQSEWERHAVGDEIVMVIEGETTMSMLIDDEERRLRLGPMQMTTVPQGTWHRFDTPVGVKLLTVTPQPTDHSVDLPTGA